MTHQFSKNKNEPCHGQHPSQDHEHPMKDKPLVQFATLRSSPGLLVVSSKDNSDRPGKDP